VYVLGFHDSSEKRELSLEFSYEEIQAIAWISLPSDLSRHGTLPQRPSEIAGQGAPEGVFVGSRFHCRISAECADWLVGPTCAEV